MPVYWRKFWLVNAMFLCCCSFLLLSASFLYGQGFTVPVLSFSKISSLSPGFGSLDWQDDGFFGGACSSIGDLDGDGISEVAVGAFGFDDGKRDGGAVFVLFPDKYGRVKSSVRISALSGGLPPGSTKPSDFFGTSVAGIGDVNGDGIEDLAVGAPRADRGIADAGVVHILFLNAQGRVDSSEIIRPLNSASVLDFYDLFGSSVSGLGDLNLDGIPDIVVGAPRDDDGPTAGQSNRGALYILFLNRDGSVKRQQKISSTQGGLGPVLDVYDQFGASVSGIGDLNQDGFPDLAAGIVLDTDGPGVTGAIRVLFLDSSGIVLSQQKISATEGGFNGQLNPLEQFGSSITAADLDGDRIQDLIVGVAKKDIRFEDDGGFFVLYMRRNGTVRSSQLISSRTPGFHASIEAGSLLGWSVTNAGDLDQNGTDDLWLGSFTDRDGGTNRGALYSIFLGDDPNCSGSGSGCGEIGGLAFIDANFTGLYENGEELVSGLVVEISGGGLVRFAQTDSTGRYALKVPPGIYTVRPVSLYRSFFELIPGRAFQVVAGSQYEESIELLVGCSAEVEAPIYEGITYCTAPNGVSIPRPAPCGGDSVRFCAMYKNPGVKAHWPDSTKFFLGYPFFLQPNRQRVISQCTPPYPLSAPIVISRPGFIRELVWDTMGAAFPANGECEICVDFYYPPNVPFAFQIQAGIRGVCDTAALLSGVVKDEDLTGYSPDCACDPNRQVVAPAGCGPQGLIRPQRLFYQVEFENIGFSDASLVRIVDSLPLGIDTSSLVLTSSNFPVSSLRWLSSHVLEIVLDSIALKPVQFYPSQGRGFVAFHLDLLPNLAVGTILRSRAFIQFDGFEEVLTAPETRTLSSQPEPLPDAGPDQLVFPGLPGYSIATLSASVRGGAGPFHYLWSTGDTTSSIQVSPDSSGYYYVLVSDVDGGCSGMDSVFVTAEDVSCGRFGDKIRVCHNGQPLCVNTSRANVLFSKGAIPGSCPSCDQTLDFDRDSSGNAFPAGTVISKQFSNLGIQLSFKNGHPGHPNLGVIFNSGQPSGRDHDLGSPNQSFGGPGIGTGGQIGRPGENRIGLGNILIIAENNVDTDQNGLIDSPDDEAKGGWMTFKFDDPVRIHSLSFIDLEGQDAAKIQLFLGNGVRRRILVDGVGDNGVQEVLVGVSGIVKLRIKLRESGGLASVSYCPDLLTSRFFKMGPGVADGRLDNVQGGSGNSGTFSGNSGVVLGHERKSVEFLVYPNPTDGMISVRFKSDYSGQGTLRIYDLYGRLVKELFQGEIEVGRGYSIREIDLSSLPGGLYCIRLNVENVFVSKKLIVN